jgi:putative glutamine amidotransferase
VKRVLVSQRVDVVPGRNERRDALDQRLIAFLDACGLLPVPVPNDPAVASALCASLAPVGVVLSGGNDLATLGGDAPERDHVEELLVDHARAAGLPVLGICRGMQFLVHRAGGLVVRVDGHVATHHWLDDAECRQVNSFHQWGVAQAPVGWRVLATAPDGTAEMAVSADGRECGIMWHPEREATFHPDDCRLVRQLFFGEKNS